MSEITLTPDTYIPSVDNRGNYIDNIPIIKNGIICLCGARKDKVYENNNKFSIHIKSQKHQNWLIMLNQNKANYYLENIKNKELIDNQKKIIANLENNLKNKDIVINSLIEKVKIKESNQVEINDLLGIN
jgi:hypothetical protein